MQEMSRFTRFGSQKKLWILGSEPKKQNFQHCLATCSLHKRIYIQAIFILASHHQILQTISCFWWGVVTCDELHATQQSKSWEEEDQDICRTSKHKSSWDKCRSEQGLPWTWVRSDKFCVELVRLFFWCFLYAWSIAAIIYCQEGLMTSYISIGQYFKVNIHYRVCRNHWSFFCVIC